MTLQVIAPACTGDQNAGVELTKPHKENVMFKKVLLLVLAGFSVISALALMEVGYLGILTPHFASWGAFQVLADLVIACGLIACWMVRDAQQTGRTVWPYLLATLLFGTFGPLAYLLLAPRRDGVRTASLAG
jgi:hypothetical protein